MRNISNKTQQDNNIGIALQHKDICNLSYEENRLCGGPFMEPVILQV